MEIEKIREIIEIIITIIFSIGILVFVVAGFYTIIETMITDYPIFTIALSSLIVGLILFYCIRRLAWSIRKSWVCKHSRNAFIDLCGCLPETKIRNLSKDCRSILLSFRKNRWKKLEDVCLKCSNQEKQQETLFDFFSKSGNESTHWEITRNIREIQNAKDICECFRNAHSVISIPFVYNWLIYKEPGFDFSKIVKDNLFTIGMEGEKIHCLRHFVDLPVEKCDVGNNNEIMILNSLLEFKEQGTTIRVVFDYGVIDQVEKNRIIMANLRRSLEDYGFSCVSLDDYVPINIGEQVLIISITQSIKRANDEVDRLLRTYSNFFINIAFFAINRQLTADDFDIQNLKNKVSSQVKILVEGRIAKELREEYPEIISVFEKQMPNLSNHYLAKHQDDIIHYKETIQDVKKCTHNWSDLLEISPRGRSLMEYWIVTGFPGLPYYYFYHYYPSTFGIIKDFADVESIQSILDGNYSRISSASQLKPGTISSLSESIRDKIWNFKNQGYDEDVVIKKLKKTFNLDTLKRLTFVCVPASTKHNNYNRYFYFSTIVCQELGMKNGFSHIEIVKENNSKHLGGSGKVEYSFDKEFFIGA